MKVAILYSAHEHLTAKELGNVLTKEQFNILKCDFKRRSNVHTIYDFIGKLYPNVPIEITTEEGEYKGVYLGNKYQIKLYNGN